MSDVVPDHDFSKAVTAECKWLEFRFAFFLIIHPVCALHIHFLPAFVDDKINLACDSLALPEFVCLPGENHAHIYGKSPSHQLKINRILHQVRHILLAETRSRVSQSEILALVFVWVVEIRLAAHVITFRFGKEKCVHQVIHMHSDGIDVCRQTEFRRQHIRDIVRIRE